MLVLPLGIGCGAEEGEKPMFDADGDTVAESEGCDDDDSAIGAIAEDNDCDAVLTADDCDNADAESTLVAEDGDCDGVLTADDCNDADASLGAVAEDGDCDGTLTADDCDDTDPALGAVADDGDCDGTLTADDCDDADASSNIVAEDGDCDGVLTADDCDDTDSASTVVADDADCDGSLTADDCDDADADVYPGALDGLLADRDCVEGTTGNSLSLADYSFVGEDSSDYAGFSVSSAGDVDGDGLDDLLVGAYQNDDGGNEAGKAYLILGASLGTTGEIDLEDADYSFVGESSEDNAGWSVSSAGDVDGDGLDDLLVGARYNGDGASYAGKAYLILGASLGTTAEIDLEDADYSFVGEKSNDNAGVSVSSAGDVDGDGLDDLLVGAYDNGDGGSGAGKVYIILGASLGTTAKIDLSLADYSFVGENGSDAAGWSVSSAGNVDGDGRDDILVGAPYNGDGGSSAGKTYLILGASLGSSSEIDLSDADYSFVGENAYDYAGRAVSSAGDVDGDGLDDLLVGAPFNGDSGTYAGKAYLILGASLGATAEIDLADADYSFVAESANDLAGFSVSNAGDVDGDDLDDLLVGAYGSNDGGTAAGKAYLILGASLGTTSEIDLEDADYSFVGEDSPDYAGWSVSSAGDVDGDGLDDILVGAYQNDDGGNEAGKAYLILSGL